MESCLRCNAVSPADEMADCSGCGFYLCHRCEEVQRCGCYEIKMTLAPEAARACYAMYDVMNATPSNAVSAAQWEAWETQLEELEERLREQLAA
jgi:hypothetical protein